MHGSYERICSGTPYYTFRDLTGAPTFEYEASDIKLLDKLKHATFQKYSMACTINKVEKKKSDLMKASGLLDNHSYSLIDVVTVKDK